MRYEEILPNEEKLRNQIARSFAEQFSAARQILNLCVRITGIYEGGIKRAWVRGTDQAVRDVALSLYCKICKLHRSIIAVCEIGLAHEAEVLLRTLFESSLMFDFILRTRVKLKQPATLPSGKGLDTRFRTRLYLAHYYIEQEKLLEIYGGTPELERESKRFDSERFRQLARQAEKIIGPEWTRIIKGKRRPKLFNVKNLAESMGWLQIYNRIYKYFSWGSHGADALFHSERDDDSGRLFLFDAKPEDILPPLNSATGLLLQSAQRLNHRFRLGFDTKIKAAFSLVSRLSKRKAQSDEASAP